MPTSPAAKVPATKKTPKPGPPAKKPATLPSLRFYPSKELHGRLLAVLVQIEQATDATVHRSKLSDSVCELTGAGLEYDFLQTLKGAKVGFVTTQAANIGLLGVQQVMAPVIRNYVPQLDRAQLQALTQGIRKLLQ